MIHPDHLPPAGGLLPGVDRELAGPELQQEAGEGEEDRLDAVYPQSRQIFNQF